MDTRLPNPILSFLRLALLTLLNFLKTPRWENPHKGLKNNYKGQMHCHSQKTTPLNVVNSYKNKGYTFVCLTDHNSATSKPDVTEGIIFIQSAESGRTFQHHIEVLGINMKAAQTDEAAPFDGDHDGICDFLTNPCDNLPGRIYYYSAIQGAVTVLGHPKCLHDHRWYDYLTDIFSGEIFSGDYGILEQGYSLIELVDNARGQYTQAQYNGQPYSYTGIEVYNASNSDNRLIAWCDDWWDYLLCRGKRVWGFGGDDAHDFEGNDKSFNRTWIIVNAADPVVKDSGKVTDEDIANEILLNIKAGNFYTVIRSPEFNGSSPSSGSEYSGPALNIKVLGNMIQVTTDPNCEIFIAYGSGWRSTRVQVNAVPSLNGMSITGIFTPPSTSQFARVEVTQQNPGEEKYLVLSQPLFNKNVETPPPNPCQAIKDRLDGLVHARARVNDFYERNRSHLPSDAGEFVDQTLVEQDRELEEIRDQYNNCLREHGLPPDTDSV